MDYYVNLGNSRKWYEIIPIFFLYLVKIVIMLKIYEMIILLIYSKIQSKKYIKKCQTKIIKAKSIII